MAGTRDRSRNRGMDRRNQYELHDMQASHRTGEGLTVHNEEDDDYDHGHPQNSGAQRLDGRILRLCKERLAGALGTCKAQSARVLRMCMKWLAKYRMTTVLMASISCILLVFAFRVLSSSAKPSDHGVEWSTEEAMEYYASTTTVSISATVYHTIKVNYVQFYGARPVHHQAPITVASNFETIGQVIPRDPSYPLVGTGTSPSVSGLFYVPISFTSGDWPQTQQDFHLTSSLASNVQGSQYMEGNASLGNLESDTKLLVQSRKMGALHELFAGLAEVDTTSFTRWGVRIVYSLRHRSRRSLHLDKGWCIENACSPHKQLSSMCNNTKSKSGSFQKQECEWCWPEDQRNHQAIDEHCTEVSKRALNAMLITCGVFLFCTLVIAIILATRMFRHRQRAEAQRSLHKGESAVFPLQEASKGVPSHRSLLSISRLYRSSKIAKGRVDDKAIENRSTGDVVGRKPLYELVFAKSEKRSGLGPLQKQKLKPRDQEMAIRDSDSHERVPVLPPAPSAINSQVFSGIENMSQGSLLSDARTNSSQNDAQGIPRPSSRPSRAVSSGSEHYSSEATHRREAAANVYNLHRLTENS